METAWLVLPLLALFTSINFEKVILINFCHIEGQSYYYMMYEYEERGRCCKSEAASVLES